MPWFFAFKSAKKAISRAGLLLCRETVDRGVKVGVIGEGKGLDDILMERGKKEREEGERRIHL